MPDPMDYFLPQALERGAALADALDHILEGCGKLADAKAGSGYIAGVLLELADRIERYSGND